MLTTEAPVISVMTVNPITISTTTSIVEIRSLLKQHRIRHLPVLGSDSKIVGLVSITDLAMLNRFPAEKLRHKNNHSSSAMTAVDFMAHDIVGLAPDDTIGLAADLFLSREMHAAPVIDDGELIGIVTSHDLLRLVFADVLPLENDQAI